MWQCDPISTFEIFYWFKKNVGSAIFEWHSKTLVCNSLQSVSSMADAQTCEMGTTLNTNCFCVVKWGIVFQAYETFVNLLILYNVTWRHGCPVILSLTLGFVSINNNRIWIRRAVCNRLSSPHQSRPINLLGSLHPPGYSITNAMLRTAKKQRHYTNIVGRVLQSVQWLATGWTVWSSNASGGEILRTSTEKPYGLPSLLQSG